jgi:hypothetical protein
MRHLEQDEVTGSERVGLEADCGGVAVGFGERYGDAMGGVTVMMEGV